MNGKITGIKESLAINASHVFVGSGSTTFYQEGKTKLILILVLTAPTHTNTYA